MQVQEGVGVQFYIFLTWALNRGGRLAPCLPLATLLQENFPGNHCKGCSVVPRAGLEGHRE
jgi:hypothetical protein